jgi:hypothetical protein
MAWPSMWIISIGHDALIAAGKSPSHRCTRTGIPAVVDLTFDLASLHIDTHVLMTLAVLGTLAIGGALEVRLLSSCCCTPEDALS